MATPRASILQAPARSPLIRGRRNARLRSLKLPEVPPHVARRRAALALGGAALLAAAVRIPFIWAGIGPDEGGYAFIAHQWAHGAALYQGVWVDRPQGLLVLYRAITDVAYHAWAIRAAAALAGVSLTLIIGAIGWMVREPATGAIAAFVFAIVGVGPHIEGFTMNSELAAAVPAAGAVACAIRWRMVGRRRWLLAAGALGAGALLMKQSGFDGIAMALVIAVATADPMRARARHAGLVLAGASVPLALAAFHGLINGWSSYWFAMYGWRAHEELGKTVGKRIDYFLGEMPRIGPDLLGVSLVALVGLAFCIRRRGLVWVIPAWFLVGFVAINVGGWYWPHYFVQVVPALVLLAAVAVTSVRRWSPPLAVVLACGAVAPVAVNLVHLVVTSKEGRLKGIPYKRGYEIDRQIARFIRDHSTPRDTFYALASRADLYFLAHRSPPIPYLWAHSPLQRRSVKDALRNELAGPGGPKFVVESRSARSLDKSGKVAQILRDHYRFVWRPPGRLPKDSPMVLMARDASLSALVPYTTHRPLPAVPGTD